ncbi:hypothetical protein [Curvivirga aplysinae]|uniref:hypothetical protein n=1 Tax=Curvivirga aplysinae TaxID=2529852 RepID=UPI0012BBDEC2|nr:hypothetical protein [Curvivirga aplysinae]MTI10406.1 hypothetical protein [Curvivirga aplysinae]
MRKQIDFSKLTLKQILFFVSGLGLSIFGMVMSIILYASNLYENRQEFPVSLSLNTAQQICEDCVLQDGDSIWLATDNRKIEYTDISLVVSVNPRDGSQIFKNESSFVVVNLRNQTDGVVYYRLATPDKQIGKEASIVIQKIGNDVLDQASSIVIRQYSGIQFNPVYILLIIIGTVLLTLATRKPKDAAKS